MVVSCRDSCCDTVRQWPPRLPPRCRDPEMRRSGVNAPIHGGDRSGGGRCSSMGVEFQVLGEVEAYLDGRRLDVGDARQRCVLASLLVDVNHVVTADRLIVRVWTNGPPLRARNALASYVSRLRRALGEDGSVRIAQRSGAYTLM